MPADVYVGLKQGTTDNYTKLITDGLGRLVTTATGNFSQSGLSTAHANVRVVITDVRTKIPLTPLADRNTMTVRVWGASTVYFGGSTITASGAATDGYPKKQYEEVQVDIKDNASVELYAICAAGESSVVYVWEVA
jgi:hypothetical protein